MFINLIKEWYENIPNYNQTSQLLLTITLIAIVKHFPNMS